MSRVASNGTNRVRGWAGFPILALGVGLAAAPASAQQFDELTQARAGVAAAATDAAAQYRLGEALLEARDFAGAKTAFETALRHRSNWVDALWGLARVKMAQGEYEASRDACRRVISAAGDSAPEGHVCMGQAYMVWRRSSLAIEEFNKALAVDDDNAGALCGLGDAHARANELDQAVESYRKAVAADANLLEARLGLATMLERKGDLAGAQAELKAALQIRPWSADAHYNLGRLGSGAEALDHLAQAVAIRPSFTDAQLEYGRKLAAAGRWSDALAPLQAAFGQLPNVGQVNELLGIALWKTGDLAGAETRLRAAIEGVPNSSRAHEGLGEVLVASNRVDDGLAELEIAANLDSTNVELLLRIAVVLRGQGRNTKATGFLDKALSLKADLSRAEVMYGDILFEAGRYADARTRYQNALNGDGVGLDRNHVQGRLQQLDNLAPQR
ncbi:MAG: tetratricopeptide repeat protein [Deltaproteobacteria bacterium]|nr:tetratricopeptide repeat protein [Deltaproteobacteria bacterium]